MRSPLLRHEMRVRRNQLRRRAAAIIIAVPVLLFAGIGFSNAAIHAGPWPTACIAAVAAFVGWGLHYLTRPLL